MPRDWNRNARRRWPKAEWICGNGQYASLAYCGVLTIELYNDLDKALKKKSFIDQCGCGSACRSHADNPTSKHQIIDLAAE